MREEISIIIPAYNEEKRLEPTLKAITQYLEKNFKTYEVLVVNDGSKDNTAEITEKFKDKKVRIIQNPKNMGKGFSVKNGMINAKYDPVLFTDADLATPIEEVEKLLKALQEGYDVAIASRNIQGSTISVHQPGYRKALGKAFPFIVKSMVLPDFKDTQCGFKLFKKEAARKIFPRQTLKRFAFDVEILYIAKQLNYKVKEVPITWVDKDGSTVSPIKDSFRMFNEVMKIRYNKMKGEYKP